MSVAMRQLAWLLLVACLVLAPSSATAGESHPMQMLIQAGFVYGPSSDTSDPGPGGTLGVLWTPWKFGGLWSELGVMDDVPAGGGIPVFSPLFNDPEAGNQRH